MNTRFIIKVRRKCVNKWRIESKDRMFPITFSWPEFLDQSAELRYDLSSVYAGIAGFFCREEQILAVKNDDIRLRDLKYRKRIRQMYQKGAVIFFQHECTVWFFESRLFPLVQRLQTGFWRIYQLPCSVRCPVTCRCLPEQERIHFLYLSHTMRIYHIDNRNLSIARMCDRALMAADSGKKIR